MLTNPTPHKQSITKRMMAGTKVPQLNQDEVIELVMRVQSLLLHHFGPGGFVVQETMSLLNDSLLNAHQNDWENAVRGPQALLKQNQHYMNLLGALLFGIEPGARPRFDPNGTLEYQILSVVQHLRYDLRPHDWSSIGAPHNWTFYLALLEIVICFANASQLAKQFDMQLIEERYDVRDRFIEQGLSSSGNEKLVEICIDEFTQVQGIGIIDRIKEEERKGVDELKNLEYKLKTLELENEEKEKEVQKYKEIQNRIDGMVKHQEYIQEQVLSAKNQHVAQLNENETAKEALNRMKEDLEIAQNQRNILEEQMRQMPLSVEENVKQRQELAHRSYQNEEEKTKLEKEITQLLRFKDQQKQYLPLYIQVSRMARELLEGIEGYDEYGISEDVRDAMKEARKQLQILRALREEDQEITVDFDNLHMFYDQYQGMILPTLERAINETRDKIENYKNLLSEIERARMRFESEVRHLESQKREDMNEVEVLQSKNTSQLVFLETKSNEYELKIVKEENETKEISKDLEMRKDEERHLEMEVEMMVREIEMLQKKQDREIEEGEKAVQQLYEFVSQEWEEEEESQIQEMQNILQLFAGLGKEGIKVCEAWMVNEGFTKEMIEDLAPQFKAEQYP